MSTSLFKVFIVFRLLERILRSSGPGKNIPLLMYIQICHRKCILSFVTIPRRHTFCCDFDTTIWVTNMLRKELTIGPTILQMRKLKCKELK